MKCNMKGARLFGKFICKAVISMGIKNPTYFLVAVLQIEFCEEQTSQSPQYLEVAQLVEYLTGALVLIPVGLFLYFSHPVICDAMELTG